MLVLDQLKRSDRKLQVLSIGILVGMLILVGGLWWVQIASSKRHEAQLKKQAYRSVRVPALRGKIFDRNGDILAENRPRYDINVYLEEVREYFWFEYTNSVRKEFFLKNPGTKLSGNLVEELSAEARYRVVSNITFQITSAFRQPQILNRKKFTNHYHQNRFIPLTLVQALTPQQVAIFCERFNDLRGIELEVQPVRTYPNTNTAAHVLGFVRWKTDFPDEEGDAQITYKYPLPDFEGKQGIESGFDSVLRGRAGIKALLIDSKSYRQGEETLVESEPGQNIWLTIDTRLQQATEKALMSAMAETRGAAVVLDVNNGDVLAMASAPTFDPNLYVTRMSEAENARLSNPKLTPHFNRATFGHYTPGSIFKIITALALLEHGNLDPHNIYRVQPDPAKPGHGAYFVGNRKIEDTAPPGEYDLVRAFKMSSNSYFIHYGLRMRFEKLVEFGRRFHLGEKTYIQSRQEIGGEFPEVDRLSSWTPGRVANLCIGQEIQVTPLQMAIMTAAVANGGKVFWPRIVSRSEAAAGTDAETISFAPARLREHIQIDPGHLDMIRRAMLADVDDPTGEGTGRAAYIPDFRAAGKTGTAQTLINGKRDKHTWFVSYAPYENPRYAVVVMVESGASGGGTCAPVAKKIYEAIQKIEAAPPKTPVMATIQ